MKKIYKLKVYVSIIFSIWLLLCAIDYMNVYFFYKRNQTIWPIFHWTLDFEKIPTVAYKGESKVISCDSTLFKKPIPIEEFVKNHGIKWKHTSYYKYFPSHISSNDNNSKDQQSLEAHILSKLPCNKLVYSLIQVKKDLRTKEESRKLLRVIEYEKPRSSL